MNVKIRTCVPGLVVFMHDEGKLTENIGAFEPLINSDRTSAARCC
ncbi:hypothetical protein [Cupriavidus sp. UYPR2.512]|nr:hypothetical protein [Cupriavidus sp. UYPR2.512]